MSIYGNKNIGELIENFEEITKKYTSDQIINEIDNELFEILNEDNRNGLLKESKAHLIKLFIHLIKFENQPERQCTSWIKSIKEAIMDLEKIKEKSTVVWNHIDNDLIEKSFNNARQDVLKIPEFKNKNISKIIIPAFLVKENLIDKIFIKNYLLSLSRNSEITSIINSWLI